MRCSVKYWIYSLSTHWKYRQFSYDGINWRKSGNARLSICTMHSLTTFNGFVCSLYIALHVHIYMKYIYGERAFGVITDSRSLSDLKGIRILTMRSNKSKRNWELPWLYHRSRKPLSLSPLARVDSASRPLDFSIIHFRSNKSNHKLKKKYSYPHWLYTYHCKLRN